MSIGKKKTIFFFFFFCAKRFFCSFSFIHSFIYIYLFQKNVEPEEEVFLLSTGRRRPCAERERERERERVFFFFFLFFLFFLLLLKRPTRGGQRNDMDGNKASSSSSSTTQKHSLPPSFPITSKALQETGSGMKALLVDGATLPVVSNALSQTDVLKREVFAVEPLSDGDATSTGVVPLRGRRRKTRVCGS